MSDINLIPKLYKEEKKSFQISRGAILTSIIIVVLCVYGVIFYFIQKDYNTYKQEEMTLNVKINKFKEINQVKDRLDFKMVKLKKMTDLLEASYVISTHNTYIFNSLLEFMPQGIYINSYSIDESNTIKITARSLSTTDISYFMHSLKSSGKFTDIKVSSITLNKTEQDKGEATFNNYTFNLDMKFVK